MAFSVSHPWNGSGRLFSSSSNASVRGNSSGSDVLLTRLRAALPAARVSVAAAPSLLGPGRQQEALQGLNERLAGYLQRVRGLEAANRALEEEIAAIRSSRAGAVGRKDWEACEQPLAALRKQVEELNMENVRLLLQIDNARLATDDFKHKLDIEQAACDSVQKDTQGLHKIIDDTNFLRLKLEGELDSLREELAYLRKSHEEALTALVANSDVTVQVDNPQKHDLSETIAEIRNQYEQVAEQNRADTENWHRTKIDSMSQEASMNTQALEQARSELSDLRRQLQGLEIERQTLQKMGIMSHHTWDMASVAITDLSRGMQLYPSEAKFGVEGYSMIQVDALENTLKNTEDHYLSGLANLNQVIASLQEDLAACRADLEAQSRDYEALLDLKTKLENEIEHYRILIEGVVDR
ncbi:hypothetical protein Chor_016085 [Crotalus horridus]